ncbi:MAG TPA: hypothetical protein DEP37_07750, partial [Algoriphagus sp.]|nr:hypothetical protein [Algoriphagus sp.]
AGGIVEVRLGSANGELLGTSNKVGVKEMGFRPPEGVDPIVWRRENANRAQVSIKPTSGKQKLYFVFKNPEVKGEEILMGINEIQFIK